MKAAPITKKPSFPLMKQGDIQNIYHLQMPRWLPSMFGSHFLFSPPLSSASRR